jgi:hypothetical protein
VRSTLAVTSALWIFALSATAAVAAEEGSILFSSDGFWRAHYTLRTPVEGDENKAEPLEHKCETPVVPDGWQQADFDDSSWRRLCGATFPFGLNPWRESDKMYTGAVYNHDSSPCLALISMRGRFTVDDPAAVGDMTLNLKYRGGVAVYLNGKEIARDNLRADAKPLDLANPYPIDASMVEATADDDSKPKVNAIKRNRETNGVKVPASALKKGVNVIAIELHRAPYPEGYSEFTAKEKYQRYVIWSTCNLISAELRAAKAVDVVSNIEPPPGISLWNSGPMEADFDADFALAGEELRPIRIVAPRGGVASGKVVMGSGSPINGPNAVVSALAGSDGAKIPAQSVQIRWARPGRGEDGANGRYQHKVTAFDDLAEQAPPRVETTETGWKSGPVAVQPIWVTVKVPADAAPGKYTATLTVKAYGFSRQVPVEVEVCDWKAPPPTQWETFVELIQSPETVAMQYDLDFWSDEHFEKLIPSLDLCGQVGSSTLYIPLINETNLGNTESMVRWSKGPDGYSFDTKIAEKYLDLAVKHQGKPDLVVFYVWDVFLEGGFLRYAKSGQYAKPEIHEALDELQEKGPRVTTVGADGKAVELQLPQYSKPGDSEAAWKQLFTQLKAELAERGLEDSMCLGMPNDAVPTKEVVEFFKRVAPGVPWAHQSHSYRKDLHGVPYVLRAHVWSTNFTVYPDLDSNKGWNRDELVVQFPRNVHDAYPLTTFRLLGERNIMGGQRGFGRLGADFWKVIKNRRGQKIGTLSNRWPFVDWRNLSIKTTLLAPGRDGAVATTRYEMMREGLQEAEARILIEKAIESGKLPGPLAKRCTEVLQDRAAAILQGLDNHHTCGFEKRSKHGWWNGPGQVGYHWFVTSPWQQRSAELFSLAGEVAKATGQE